MGTILQWAAATYTGEGPVADATRAVVVAKVMFNQDLDNAVRQPTKQSVQDALEGAERLVTDLRILLNYVSSAQS